MEYTDSPNDLPEQIAILTADRSWQRVTSGYSGDDVFRLIAPGAPAWIVKMSGHPETSDVAAEARHMQWLAGRLPVPQLIAYEATAGRSFLLMSELPGIDASDTRLYGDILGLVHLLANGLRMVHAVPIADCPFDRRIAASVAEARRRVARQLVDPDEFDHERQGRSVADLLQELEATIPQNEDLVFTHGDYCLPNILIDQGRVSGFIDLGRAGIGDRYRDLALAARSIVYNVGQEWVAPFFEAYGVEPDQAKIEWYKLLDEFF